nr:3-mercaptopyruvate sulfurtransferase [uncultured Moellerella sp.]
MYDAFFVTPEWLNAHLQDPNVIVLDVSAPPPTAPVDCRELWRKEHIPQAQFFHQDEIADHQTDLPHMLPSEALFSTTISNMGIGPQTAVIIYDQGNLFAAPRAFWTFNTLGCHNVKILAGGLAGWKSAGFATESGEVIPPAPQQFVARRNENLALSQAEMLDIVKQSSRQIIDARSADRFQALAPEPRPGLRMGHIPGSKNMPWNLLVEEGKFKSPETLKALFLAQEIDITAPSVTTCGSGMTAAIVLLALTLLGNKDLQLYDGSWADWGKDNGLPIES